VIIQVIEILYYADARGADWATARNAIKRVHPDRIAVEDEFTLIYYQQAKDCRFKMLKTQQQEHKILRDYGIQTKSDAVKMFPGIPTWGQPKRSQNPPFSKILKPGNWAQYWNNARLASYSGQSYYEWTINISNSQDEDGIYVGDPAWVIDNRGDLF
jgi:hypothetical protein